MSSRARALHGRAPTGEPTGRLPSPTPDDEVAHHYKLALELRDGNFPLAALNLGSYQYASLNQLESARETFEMCANKMRPDKTKTRRQHVRVQIECLISGAKLWLAARSSGAAASDSGASGKQTNSDAAAENCPKLLELMQEAKSRIRAEAHGVVGDENWTTAAAAAATISDELHQLGDSARQMALVHWITSKCVAGRAEELTAAVEWADRSQVSLEAQIYLDYASVGIPAGAGPERAVEFLANVIGGARQKKLVRPFELAKLHHALAKELLAAAAKSDDDKKKKEQLELASRQMDEAIRLKPDEVGFLSFGAQLAFDLGQAKKSERLYLGALQLLSLQSRQFNNNNGMAQREHGQSKRAKRLAQAHTNYGAILQVNGRPEEAEQHYRQALDCDPHNSNARANLARLVSG